MRYELTTAKGDFAADTLAEIADWQRDMQASFATLRDNRTLTEISVDDIDFHEDNDGAVAMLEHMLALEYAD